MKDYYQTLGIPEDADEDAIRKAFRKLAFQFHPDKNLGHEKEAEEKFKDINEAYGVLSDKSKREQYDMLRKGNPAGSAAGFQYSQQDIFRDIFTNQASMDELNRLFAQGGLRFDQEFLNRVFFNADNVVFRVYYGGPRTTKYSYSTGVQQQSGQAQEVPVPRHAGIVDRFLMRVLGFFLKRLFGIQTRAPVQNLNLYLDFEVPEDEAREGGERMLVLKTEAKPRKLMVRIPAGIQSGMQIRLRGLGKKQDRQRGDLYLKVKVLD
jgi:DnaJ-class molecular chaperone